MLTSSIHQQVLWKVRSPSTIQSCPKHDRWMIGMTSLLTPQKKRRSGMLGAALYWASDSPTSPTYSCSCIHTVDIKHIMDIKHISYETSSVAIEVINQSSNESPGMPWVIESADGLPLLGCRPCAHGAPADSRSTCCTGWRCLWHCAGGWRLSQNFDPNSSCYGAFPTASIELNGWLSSVGYK